MSCGSGLKKFWASASSSESAPAARVQAGCCTHIPVAITVALATDIQRVIVLPLRCTPPRAEPALCDHQCRRNSPPRDWFRLFVPGCEEQRAQRDGYERRQGSNRTNKLAAGYQAFVGHAEPQALPADRGRPLRPLGSCVPGRYLRIMPGRDDAHAASPSDAAGLLSYPCGLTSGGSPWRNGSWPRWRTWRTAIAAS